MEIHKNQNTSRLQIAVILLLCGTLGVLSSALAEEIYKSVDAHGNVTYSSIPPKEAVETQPVTVPDAPSEAQREEAVQREKKLQRAADNLERELSARDSQRNEAAQNAENTLDQAKAQLEQAKVMQDSDWQGKAGGGRRLKESYFERVREAEEALSQAKEADSKARLDTR